MFKKAFIRCRCGRWLLLHSVRFGDVFHCRWCRARLRIVGLSPEERIRRAYRTECMN